MKLWKRMFFYGLTCVSLNLASCNKEESPTEAVQKVDYLKPLLGTWRQIEQNNFRVEYLVKKVFSSDRSYTFSIEDTVNHDFRAFKASIDEITNADYKAHITNQFGSYSRNMIGWKEGWNYFISGNRLYENDGTLYNTYIKQ